MPNEADTTSYAVGDLVEVLAGPYKERVARVVGPSNHKQQVTLEVKQTYWPYGYDTTHAYEWQLALIRKA